MKLKCKHFTTNQSWDVELTNDDKLEMIFFKTPEKVPKHYNDKYYALDESDNVWKPLDELKRIEELNLKEDTVIMVRNNFKAGMAHFTSGRKGNYNSVDAMHIPLDFKVNTPKSDDVLPNYNPKDFQYVVEINVSTYSPFTNEFRGNIYGLTNNKYITIEEIWDMLRENGKISYGYDNSEYKRLYDGWFVIKSEYRGPNGTLIFRNGVAKISVPIG